MSLVLPPQPVGRLAIRQRGQTPEVVEHEDPATAEDFELLFGKAPVAVGEVVNRAVRTIGKTQSQRALVVGHARTGRWTERRHETFGDRMTDREAQQIDEVTRL